MPRLAWLVLTAGCATSASAPDVREPEPYLPDLEVTPPEPTLDGLGVATVLEERFAALVTTVPTGFPAAFDEAFAALAGETDADAGRPCPEVILDTSTGSLTTRYVQGFCTTASGVVVQGTIDYAYENGRMEDEAWVEGMEFFAQNFRVETPDGRYLEADGYFSFSYRTDDDSQWGSSYCDGAMAADPVTAGNDVWMSGLVDGLVAVFVGDFSGYRVANVNASVAVDDPEIVGVAMEDLGWEPGQCDVEMLGRASLREANGVWHDVVFAQRRDDDQAPVRGCDGCGSYLAGGSPRDGRVCNTDALSSLIDWSGGLPW